jgi:hypothetical protein
MGKPKDGELRWKKDKVDVLAQELKDWMYENEEEWMIEKFSTMKKIPYRYFETVFPETSNLFKETMELCLDLKKVRYWQAVVDKKIPPTFGIFGSKNELEYRDRVASDDKKSTKKEQPTKQGVKDAIAKAKEKYFGKPD